MKTPLRGELTKSSHPAAPSQQAIEQNFDVIQGVLSHFLRLSTPSTGPQIIVSPSSTSETPAEAAAPWSWTAAEASSAESALLPFLIHLSAARNDLESLNYCLSADAAASDENSTQGRSIPGGLVNCVDPASGRSPLHVAALNGSVQCVATLLRSGALVHQRDALGHTALYYVSVCVIMSLTALMVDRLLAKHIHKQQSFLSRLAPHSLAWIKVLQT